MPVQVTFHFKSGQVLSFLMESIIVRNDKVSGEITGLEWKMHERETRRLLDIQLSSISAIVTEAVT